MPLDKQIRLRASDEEKTHLEIAAKDGGFENLSDYLRPILLDRNVIIVKPSGEFIVIPAFTADEEAREEAVLTVQGLVALASSLGDKEASPALPVEAALPPEAPAPAAGEDEAPAAPVDPDVPPAGIELDGAAPPAPTLAAAPAPASTVSVILGPTPQEEETYDAFMARRNAELQLQGRTALVSTFEADAEWRMAAGIGPGTPTAPAEPEAAVPAKPAFCPHCGTPNSGTAFCAGCGASLA